jgi:hypothetical protein
VIVMLRLGVIVAVLVAAGCGGENASSPGAPSPAETPGTTLSFSAALVDPANVDFILPLGNLNPPAHTFPSDHIYFYVGFLRPEIRLVPVFAPGDGTVQTILRSAAPDVKMFVRATTSLTYYVDHVVLDPEIREGMRLTAGQRLGTSGPTSFGVDLGVINANLTQRFVVPARYPGDTIHADAPLKYYEEPLRSQLYGMVRRESADKDGRIDFDVPGRLSGNWFLEGLPIAESAQPTAWARHLAFVFDNVQPSMPRISIGGRLALAGLFGVDGSGPPFESVGPESGLVTYRLRTGGHIGAPLEASIGTLLVQMLDATHIRVESIPGASPTAFSAAAVVYTR